MPGTTARTLLLSAELRCLLCWAIAAALTPQPSNPLLFCLQCPGHLDVLGHHLLGCKCHNPSRQHTATRDYLASLAQQAGCCHGSVGCYPLRQVVQGKFSSIAQPQPEGHLAPPLPGHRGAGGRGAQAEVARGDAVRGRVRGAAAAPRGAAGGAGGPPGAAPARVPGRPLTAYLRLYPPPLNIASRPCLWDAHLHPPLGFSSNSQSVTSGLD